MLATMSVVPSFSGCLGCSPTPFFFFSLSLSLTRWGNPNPGFPLCLFIMNAHYDLDPYSVPLTFIQATPRTCFFFVWVVIARWYGCCWLRFIWFFFFFFWGGWLFSACLGCGGPDQKLGYFLGNPEGTKRLGRTSRTSARLPQGCPKNLRKKLCSIFVP